MVAPYPKQIDNWAWGKETIIWGSQPQDQYTFKLLAPKKGKEGMLSLQYHHHKSETWFQLKGIGWALVIVNNTVCTRLMYPGDIQNLPTGTIHRLMAVTDDCQVLEPSTPDKHAADKTAAKDIVRLHCVFGRPVEAAKNEAESALFADAIKVSLEAGQAVEQGQLPVQINTQLLYGSTGFALA